MSRDGCQSLARQRQSSWDYEDEQGKTCVEYDRPSSLFGQFGNDRIAPTAAMLDRKLEALVSASFE